MKSILFSFICTVILLLSGCKEGNQPLSDNLEGRKWILVKLVHNDSGAEEPVPGNFKNINITFNDDYSLHGLGGCNTIDGDYTISGEESLTIEHLGRTKMYCGGEIMNWEEKFYSALKGATSYSVSGESLTIKSASDITLVFKSN